MKFASRLLPRRAPRARHTTKVLAGAGLSLAMVVGASWFPPVTVTEAALPAGATFQLQVTGVAGVPANAAAVTLNLAAVNPSGAGYLTVYPCGGTRPNASTLNFQRRVTIANSATVQVGTGGKVCLFSNATTDLIADVAGWYPAGSDFSAVNPTRLLDTRTATAQAAGSTRELTVAGVAANAEAVTLNLTAVTPSATGYVTAYPCGSTRPNASTLNFQQGITIANSATVQVGTGGKVCLYTSATTHLIADIAGWYPATSSYTPLNAVRVLDTRATGAQAAGSTNQVQIGGLNGVPANAEAVTINVAAVDPAAAGYLTVYPCGGTRPNASTLNFQRGVTIANSATVQVGAGGAVCIFTSATTQLVSDLVGWYPAGSSYTPLNPTRLLDTRTPTPGAQAFVEDFTGNAGFERFDHGMYHRDNFLVAQTQWTGDHDLNCGTPDTQRLIHRSNPEESFYLCKDHLMTSVGDTSGYSIAWFSPKQVFQYGQVTQVSWDVNVTDLGNRQWWEVSLVPIGEEYLATKDFAAVAAQIPTYGPQDIVVGKGPYGNDGNIYSGGVQRDPLGFSHICDLDPEGCASKAIRRTFTITDNLNGTITFDFLGKRFTYPGKFPSQFRVYFKDHNYTPDKDGVPIGHTWHWDTIVIR